MNETNNSNNIRQSVSCPHFPSAEKEKRPKLSVKNVPKWKPQDVIRYLEHVKVFPRHSSIFKNINSTPTISISSPQETATATTTTTMNPSIVENQRFVSQDDMNNNDNEVEYDLDAIQELKSAFIQERIGGMQFLHLDKDDLIALGARSIHLRLSILFHIDKLKKINDAYQSKYIAKHAAKEAIAEYISIIDQEQNIDMDPEEIVNEPDDRRNMNNDHHRHHHHRNLLRNHHFFNFYGHHHNNNREDNNNRDRDHNDEQDGNGGFLAKVKSVTFSNLSRNQSTEEVDVDVDNHDHNNDRYKKQHKEGLQQIEEEEEEIGKPSMLVQGRNQYNDDNNNDNDNDSVEDEIEHKRIQNVEGEQSRTSVETTLSSLEEYDDNSPDQEEKTRITAKKIWKNMLRARHADTLAPVPTSVQLATIWVSISALLQAIADIILEMLIASSALPKLPLRLAFLFLTGLSALLAYNTLKGVKRRKLDVTSAAIQVSFFIESSLVVDDLVFILTREEGPFPAAYIRIPFICLTSVNIVLIVYTALKLHLVPGIKNWCLE